MSIHDEVNKIVAQEKPIYEMGEELQDVITGEIGIVVGILQAYGATAVYELSPKNLEEYDGNLRLPEGRLVRTKK